MKRRCGLFRMTWGVAMAIVMATPDSVHAQSLRDSRPQIPLGLDLYLPVPRGNALTLDKVALGRRLFFDPILSRDSSRSCASCHDPARAFADGRARSIGVGGRATSRSAPSLINRVYGESQFWDGRVGSLELQVLGPIEHQDEMGNSLAEVIRRLRSYSASGYAAQFGAVTGRTPDADGLTSALASYVRTILSGDSPFDRYSDGDTAALSAIQRDGLRVFRGKARCATCHVGSRLSDESFHNTGVAWVGGRLADSGRFTVTRSEAHLGAFKTPTLREIARSAPYMHDGSLATLEDVVRFYDRGGHANPFLAPELRPLRLNDHERVALVAFLRSLSGVVKEGWP